uniref:Uncharacterized protein n=1 Tax=Timema genevievae TaxID=629358 RepID=A0A7R9JYJ8_TIMGE|nr:unnamed protein product [Timema genevievae]
MGEREPNHPLLVVWDVNPLLGAPNDPSYSERYSAAFQNLKKSQRRVVEVYNRGRVPVNIAVDDLVMCRCFPQSYAIDKITRVKFSVQPIAADIVARNFLNSGSSHASLSFESRYQVLDVGGSSVLSKCWTLRRLRRRSLSTLVYVDRDRPANPSLIDGLRAALHPSKMADGTSPTNMDIPPFQPQTDLVDLKICFMFGNIHMIELRFIIDMIFNIPPIDFRVHHYHGNFICKHCSLPYCCNMCCHRHVSHTKLELHVDKDCNSSHRQLSRHSRVYIPVCDV